MKGFSILDHVPIEDSIHKENTIKPGPWNSGNKRGPLIAPTVKAGFKSKDENKIYQTRVVNYCRKSIKICLFTFLVHEDQSDDADMEKIKLFPNHVAFCDGSKCHDSLRVPVYVADPIDPNIVQKPHYPKELVYADNVDCSMEEIRAQLYFERYCCKKKKIKLLGVCIYLMKIYTIIILSYTLSYVIYR